MNVWAYFDVCSSLKCHPCYHDKKPFFLYEIIIEVIFFLHTSISFIVSEYDQEIPQSQTADSPVAPRGRAAQP